MERNKIKEYVEKCSPYFETLNKKQKIQFITALPLTQEEFMQFVSALLTTANFNIHTNIEDVFSTKKNENHLFVR